MEKIKIAFRDYLEKEKGLSAHTVLAYCADLDSFHEFLFSEFNQENFLDVNYAQIRSWIVVLVDLQLSVLSVNRKVASLKSFYKFLLKTRQIEISPLLTHKSLKVSKRIQVPFSENEMRVVLDSDRFSGGFDGIRDQLMIELLYGTGMRRSELINLRLDSVDFSSETLKVMGKGGKERILPLLSEVVDRIRVYIYERSRLDIVDKDSFFLTSKGVKLSDSLVYRLVNYYFGGISQKAKKSPHVLRHTFATHLLNCGAELNSVKDLLGHSSLAATQIYTGVSFAEIKETYKGSHPRGLKNDLEV